MPEELSDAERSRRSTRENLPIVEEDQPKAVRVSVPIVKPYRGPPVRQVNTRMNPDQANAQERKDIEFLNACARGDATAVVSAIKSGQEINLANDDGTSAVHLACRELDDADVLDALLKKSPDIMFANRRGEVCTLREPIVCMLLPML